MLDYSLFRAPEFTLVFPELWKGKAHNDDLCELLHFALHRFPVKCYSNLRPGLLRRRVCDLLVGNTAFAIVGTTRSVSWENPPWWPPESKKKKSRKLLQMLKYIFYFFFDRTTSHRRNDEIWPRFCARNEIESFGTRVITNHVVSIPDIKSEKTRRFLQSQQRIHETHLKAH